MTTFYQDRLGTNIGKTQKSAVFSQFDNDRVAIIGFPEHQFTEALSATAEFAALTGKKTRIFGCAILH